MKKGFTLIELLVVVSIIVVLSGVILVALNSARSKARDAQRVSDFRQIQTALELYRDKYGTYPKPTSASCSLLTPFPGYTTYYCADYNAGVTYANWITGLEEFMPTVPNNPSRGYNSLPGWSRYRYVYNTDIDQYLIMTILENSSKDTCSGGAHYPQYGLIATPTTPDPCVDVPTVSVSNFYMRSSLIN